MTKYTNTSTVAVHVKGFGVIAPGETIEIPSSDQGANDAVAALSQFEAGTASKKSAKKGKK